MHTSNKSIISLLATKFHQLRHAIKRWIRQEIVDDDPCDVETLFADSKTSTDAEE